MFYSRLRITLFQIATLLLVVLLPAYLHAQEEELELAPESTQFPNQAMRVETTQSAEPKTPGATLSLASGYGFSGAVLDAGGRHHRATSKAALSFAFSPELSVALQLDGRYNRHTRSVERDDSWVGDPRLFVHYRRSMSSQLSVGTRLAVWAPGSSVPSIVADALSVEALTTATLRPGLGALLLSANLGYRLDRSAAAVSNVDLLSKADQLSLGLSDYNALLFRVGASYQLSKMSVFSSWNLDTLHGSNKPTFRESPMAVDIGARYPISDKLHLFALATLRLNTVEVDDLATERIPFNPHAQFSIGASMNFGASSKPAATDLEPIDPPVDPDPVPEPIATYSVKGVIEYQNAPIPGALVVGIGSDGTEFNGKTAEDGTFLLENVPEGSVELSVQASGYEESKQVLNADENLSELRIQMVPILPPGQLRGVVRSFGGSGLKAKLRITPSETSITSAGDGTFTIDLPPGDYEMEVTAKGFKTQIRQVHIDEDGVTIVNIDLRK